jgi:hypothetical protein
LWKVRDVVEIVGPNDLIHDHFLRPALILHVEIDSSLRILDSSTTMSRRLMFMEKTESVTKLVKNNGSFLSSKAGRVTVDPTKIHGSTIRILLPSIISNDTPTPIIWIKVNLDRRSFSLSGFLEFNVGVPSPLDDRVSDFLFLDIVTAIFTANENVLERFGTEIPELGGRSKNSLVVTSLGSNGLDKSLGRSGNENILTELSNPFGDSVLVPFDFGSCFRFRFDRGWGRSGSRCRSRFGFGYDRSWRCSRGRCRLFDFRGIDNDGLGMLDLEYSNLTTGSIEPSLGEFDRHLVPSSSAMLESEVDPVSGFWVDIGDEAWSFIFPSSKESQTMVGSDRGSGSRYLVETMVTLPIIVDLDFRYVDRALGLVGIDQDYHVVKDLEIGSMERNSGSTLTVPLVIAGFTVVSEIRDVGFVKIVKVIDVLGFGEMILDQTGQFEITFVPSVDSDSVVFLLPATLAW